MECTLLTPSKKFATLLCTMWPPMDALLTLVIASFATCVMVKRNVKAYLPKFFSLASRRCCMLLNSWIIVTKMSLTTMKPRFYSFPQDHIRDYLFYGQCDFDTDALEDLKNFSGAILTPTHPRNMIIMTTKAKLLTVTKPLSLIVIVAMIVHPSNPPSHHFTN